MRDCSFDRLFVIAAERLANHYRVRRYEQIFSNASLNRLSHDLFNHLNQA